MIGLSTVQKFEPKNNTPIIIVKSRFGEFEIDSSKALFFPKGLYGFPNDLHFSLVNFPSEGLAEFKVLQCLNDHSISIPVLPAAFENNIIDAADMEECLKTVEVKKENFALLFIASSIPRADGKGFDISINAKAPIVIDTKLQMGVQYIFTNNKYSISHLITK